MRIALIQAKAPENRRTGLETAIVKIRQAAGQGARVVCLQELFLTPYFCQTQNPANFDLAEPVPGPTAKALGQLAKELEVVIIAPLFEKQAPGVYYNTAAVLDADGACLGKYRKTHIPQDPGFEEKYYFTPGDLGVRMWPTHHGKIGILICWDQWFPETARLAALEGAEILFCPSAIGWLSAEKETFGAAQYQAWETVQRGHAVANGCYVAAVNRAGAEGNIEFWGQSFVCDCYGRITAQASQNREEILLADCDLSALEDFRRAWPFFRDRRPEVYKKLTDNSIQTAPKNPGFSPAL